MHLKCYHMSYLIITCQINISIPVHVKLKFLLSCLVFINFYSVLRLDLIFCTFITDTIIAEGDREREIKGFVSEWDLKNVNKTITG